MVGSHTHPKASTVSDKQIQSANEVVHGYGTLHVLSRFAVQGSFTFAA